MRFTLQVVEGYLRAEVAGRATADEGRSVVDAILAERAKTGVKKILVLVRQSVAMFRVDSWDISGYLTRLAAIPGLRIALASDSRDLYASHEYIALLAKHRGVEVRAFSDEAKARQWLLAATA